eukprot:CAMPEP_0174274922 /NCGR_PEP_ID=MMETSP0439-20130205/59538_1 /TAXON_ID=0 /ORGANISM="Stereomyxa ramosa, Strain Chinc5" /LENGTH=259 /DNA_ID=CAMNT_0015366975 /DNA_START=448 /DNA_END=1227 /DNA_ORIENTATION=-
MKWVGVCVWMLMVAVAANAKPTQVGNAVDDVNKVFAALVDFVNPGLASIIKNAGLDPITEVTSAEASTSINLGICTATAKASVEVTDLSGLSSLWILFISASGADDSNPSITSFSGALGISANDTLSANVRGEASAGCGFISKTISISGSVSISGLVAKAEITGTADLHDVFTPSLNTTTLSGLYLGWDDLDVHIDDLGIFGVLLNPIVDAIIDALEPDLEDAISGKLQDVLQGVINDQLPFTVSLSDSQPRPLLVSQL